MTKRLQTRAAAPRLVATARDMFVRRGTGVGINEVLAAAGVARRSLYANFGSKTALTKQAFMAEAEDRRTAFDAIQAQQCDPHERVLALFDLVAQLAQREGFRGCAFINLAIETADPSSELHGLAKAHKAWVLQRIARDLEAAGYTSGEAQALAEQIRVVWDGAIVGAYLQGTAAPIAAARGLVERLLDGS